MKVLMISTDKSLVGGKALGDVIERHKKYGEYIEALDIIVLSKKGYREKQISEKVRAIPTCSFGKIGYFFDALRLAKQLFSKTQYDLIVTQDPNFIGLIGAMLKKNFHSKLLVHFHGDFRLNILSRYTVTIADGVRVMSQGQKQKLLKAGIAESKIRVISTPVDIGRFANFETNANAEQKNLLMALQKKSQGKKIILSVGRPDSIKDFETLYEAIRIASKREASLQIGFWRLGSSDLPEDLSEIGEAFGRVNTEDIPAYYLASDVVVSSSLSESFGKVLIEANACGKPVVATATTGAKEIVKDGVNGFLAPVGDADKLAEKILLALKDQDKAREMGERGRSMAKERYSNNTEKIIQFWQDIINAKNSKLPRKPLKSF